VNDKWFTNRGQAIQTLLALIACIFAGVKAFPDFQRSHFFTIGSLLFIFIAASVVVSILQFGLTVRSEHQKAGRPNSSITVEPKVTIFSGQYRGKIFAYSCGLSRIGKDANGVWTATGSTNAAVATFKNETNKVLRNVSSHASFYDDAGREIATCQIMWIDEEHDNTGFAPEQIHSLVIAVLASDADKCFSLTSGRRLKEGNISVKLNIFIDDGEGRELIHFNLSTAPYLGLTAVKP
jgi:hypothetical protein